MVSNRNSVLAEEVRDVFKLQQNIDGIISNLGNQIIPVCDVNPKHARIANVIASQVGTGGNAVTIYNVPSDKEFYLTGALISIAKDAANDNATGRMSLNVYPYKGANNTELIRISVLTLTAQSQTVSRDFTIPIRLEPGSTITVGATTSTVGNISKCGCITGYSIENPKA